MRTQTLVDQGDRRPLDGERHLLVRLGGELCTKSPRTRRRFLAVLTRNARAALRREGIAAEVTSEWTRLVKVGFSSHDLAVELGAALLPAAARVDLSHPDVEVTVELHDGHAEAVLESSPGTGGLPLGTGGHAVSLFSGGFDSPVAAWRVMRRGTQLDLLICDLGGCGQMDQALAVAKELALRWTPGLEPRFWVVDLAPVVLALTRRANPRRQ